MIFPADADRAIILSGMIEIAKYTCIRFVPRTTEEDYLRITNDNTGCWSYVGRTGGAQSVNLDANEGCVSKGVTMHELLHALGFFHTHSDMNRDQYIKVNYENIESSAVGNFASFSNSYVSNYGHGYDYGSIMHFGIMSFSKNGLPTLEPLEPYEGKIGQREALSVKDILKIREMYFCPREGDATTEFPFGKLPY